MNWFIFIDWRISVGLFGWFFGSFTLGVWRLFSKRQWTLFSIYLSLKPFLHLCVDKYLFSKEYASMCYKITIPRKCLLSTILHLISLNTFQMHHIVSHAFTIFHVHFILLLLLPNRFFFLFSNFSTSTAVFN